MKTARNFFKTKWPLVVTWIGVLSMIALSGLFHSPVSPSYDAKRDQYASTPDSKEGPAYPTKVGVSGRGERPTNSGDNNKEDNSNSAIQYVLYFISFVNENGGFFSFVATAIIAIFTGLLFFSTRGLWRATNTLARFSEQQTKWMHESMVATWKTAHASEQTARVAGGANKLAVMNAERQEQQLKILERAYIGIDIGNIRSLTNESGYIARIIVSNAGNLPARNICWVFGEPHFTDDGHWRPDSDLSQPSGAVTLVPGAQMTQGGPKLTIPPNMSPPKFLYIWGYVRYHDGFEDDRITQFCHRYNLELFERRVEGTGGRAFPKKACRHNRYYNDAT